MCQGLGRRWDTAGTGTDQLFALMDVIVRTLKSSPTVTNSDNCHGGESSPGGEQRSDSCVTVCGKRRRKAPIFSLLEPCAQLSLARAQMMTGKCIS